MSRIGVKPIEVPSNVEVSIRSRGRLGGQSISVKGPLGELNQDLRKEIICKKVKGKLVFSRLEDTKFSKSLHGLYRSLVENMINGVIEGYKKELELVGIGYKAGLKGDTLEVIAGATHPFVFKELRERIPP